MTKEPGGDVEEAGPSPILDDDEGGDIIPLMPEPGEPTPGVPLLPPGVDTPPTKGDGEAWGIASGVGISLPYSPFCFPAFERAQSPESVALYSKREREREREYISYMSFRDRLFKARMGVRLPLLRMSRENRQTHQSISSLDSLLQV